MTTHLAHLAHRPLALLPSAIDSFALRFAEPAALAPQPEATRFVGARPAGAPYRAQGETAIISILNPLVGREGQGWGTTSYEFLSFAIESAASDPKVRSLLLDLDSPGGHVTGMTELASTIRRVNSSKPVTASVNGLCCSAGYCLASAARSIVTTPSSTIGSIGVVMVHGDFSRALDKAGVTPSLVFAGAKKTQGNMYQPLSQDDRAALQKEVDGFYSILCASVAAGRGYRLTESAARSTEAATYIGKDAVKAGLADTIGGFDQALASARRAGVGATQHVVSLPPAASAPKPQPKAEEAVCWDAIVSELNRKLHPWR